MHLEFSLDQFGHLQVKCFSWATSHLFMPYSGTICANLCVIWTSQEIQQSCEFCLCCFSFNYMDKFSLKKKYNTKLHHLSELVFSPLVVSAVSPMTLKMCRDQKCEFLFGLPGSNLRAQITVRKIFLFCNVVTQKIWTCYVCASIDKNFSVCKK